MSGADADGKRILVWGLGTGILCTLFLFVRDRTLDHGSAALGSLDTLLMFGASTLAMVAARRSPPLSFLRALRLGAGVGFIAATLSRLYLFVQLRFVDDAWFDTLRDRWAMQMRSQGADEAEVQAFVDSFAPTALGYAAWNGLSAIVAVLVFCAVLALFLRKSE